MSSRYALRAALALTAALALPQAAMAAPKLPPRWPHRLAIGITDAPGGAAALRRHTRATFRYQYLAGGVNTGSGWSTWNPAGTFASLYIAESKAAGVIPVFSYYQLQQSRPGAGSGLGEDAVIRLNLRTPATMKAFYQDLALLFRRAHETPTTPVVVRLEPDLWGYVEQASRGDDGRTVAASVASTGMASLKGLPNTAAGVARAVVRLRDRLAPNVILGLHVSIWGTKTDIGLQDPPASVINRLSARSARFVKSLGPGYDVLFTDIADRDAGYRASLGQSGYWWSSTDFARFRLYAAGLTRATGKPLVVWQIPVGNTVMRSVDDTVGHYADNRVQALLGAGSTAQARLRSWRSAGVVALMFGGGDGQQTCACDARHDGVTNPAPVHGNTRRATSADDDGGYLAERSRAYAARPLPLG